MYPLFHRTKAAASNAYGAMTKVIGGLWSRFNGQGWGKVRVLLPSARFDWEREAGHLWSNSIVALAISWLGDRFSRPLIRVSKIAKNGDYQPLGRHNLVDLWNRPNEHYGRRTMEKAIGLSLKTDGNAYVYKVRDRMGRPVELWWIPHYRCFPTWPEDGSKYLDGYTVTLDSVQYHLDAADVIHIRDGIDPLNERCGLAALKGNIRECVTVNLESSYSAAILKNQGVPGLAIVPDSDVVRPNKEDAQIIKDRFADATSGDNAGSTVVMAGKYRIERIGLSPEEMTIDKLPLPAVARLAASIGVATMSLGLPDPNKTYSNLAEANKTSWGTIVAVQELTADALRWGLLPEFGVDPHSYVVEYDYSHVQELQESLDAVHLRTREDFKADLTMRNEAREQIGYDPDPSKGDMYFSEIQAGTAVEAAIGEDGKPIEGEGGGGGIPVGGDVQQTALSGAQIASLVQIVQAVTEGIIPGDSARAMIQASFPSLDEAEVENIIGPAEDHEAPPPPAPVLRPGLPAPGGAPKPPPSAPGVGKAIGFNGRNGGGY